MKSSYYRSGQHPNLRAVPFCFFQSNCDCQQNLPFSSWSYSLSFLIPYLFGSWGRFKRCATWVPDIAHLGGRQLGIGIQNGKHRWKWLEPHRFVSQNTLDLGDCHLLTWFLKIWSQMPQTSSGPPSATRPNDSSILCEVFRAVAAVRVLAKPRKNGRTFLKTSNLLYLTVSLLLHAHLMMIIMQEHRSTLLVPTVNP